MVTVEDFKTRDIRINRALALFSRAASEKQYLHIHHSQSSSRNTSLSDIYAWHKKRGFNEIGYHFLVFREDFVLGRSVDKKPASIENHNLGALAVCFVGNFDSELPTAFQEKMLQLILKQWKVAGHVDFTDVFAHRDLDNRKSCPGANLYNLLQKCKKEVLL